MSALILTPDERAFALALVVLASTSAATLASFFHAWRGAAPAGFLPAYAATMAIVITLSLTLLGLPNFEVLSWGRLASALLGGAIAFFIGQRGEAWIARRVRRRPVRGTSERLPIGLRLVRPDLTKAPGPSGASVLTWLMIVAVGEEVLFRGILVELALLAPGGWAAQAALLAASVVIFALSHAQLSLTEALLKLPLSVACLAACLVSGTILAPIAAHVGYNAWMWRLANDGRRSVKPPTAIANDKS